MKNKIAKVIFNLPIEWGFDYLIPKGLSDKINIGSRVMAPLANKKMIGYVTALKTKSKFKKLKSIISSIDKQPIIDKRYIKQLKLISEYYCCSLGEMIETALPVAVRKSKNINISVTKKLIKQSGEGFQVFQLRELSEEKKWEIYLKKIKEILSQNKSVIFLVPEINYIKDTFNKFGAEFKNEVAVLYGKQPRRQGLGEWIRIKEGKARIALGVISAVFAPVENLGLIIVEDEDNYAYKYDQSPHYHARQVAIMRAKQNKATVFLSSQINSIESYFALKTKRYKLLEASEPEKGKLNVQVLDMKEERFRQKKKNLILSSFLENEIHNTLSSQGKAMLFINRKGFSTFIHCRSCGYTLKCPRCSVALTYHYDKKFLRCRFCNYETKVISICPNCQSSYMRYLGLGTEKLESEMHRVFPQARIKRWDKASQISEADFDILISTQFGLKKENLSVELLGVLSPELSLNRIDFRAAEKTFSLLYRLSKLAKDKMIIQTYNPSHYSIQAISKDNPDYFYEQELKNRKELGFPPFKHLVQIILRGKNQERAKSVSESLFEKLKIINRKKGIEIYEPVPAIPSKLRGNFYWDILLKSNSVKKICSLIRQPVLEYKNKSGVITTVDVDI